MSDAAILGNADGSIDTATLAMPDIAALEAEQGLSFKEDAAPAPRADGRDDLGRFKGKELAPEAEKDVKAETEAKPAEAAADDDDDPFVEFPAAEDGKEPVREKLSKVWEGYQRSSQLEKDLEAAKNATRVLAPPEVEQAISQVAAERQKAIEWAQSLRALITPRDPDVSMLNPQHPSYDPTAYYAQLQSRDQANAFARQLDEQIAANQAQLQKEQGTQLQVRAQRESEALFKLWPELKQESVQQAVKADLARHYGLDDGTIRSVVDHRFFALAKDALAYRAAKAQEAAAVKKVTAKPKLVPSIARNPQSSQQRNRADGFSRLQQSGSIEDAASALDGLI